jgi:hypothetical protein
MMMRSTAGCLVVWANSVPLSRYTLPDCAVIHQELKRKGVTLKLLWHKSGRWLSVSGNPALHKTAHFQDAVETWFSTSECK